MKTNFDEFKGKIKEFAHKNYTLLILICLGAVLIIVPGFTQKDGAVKREGEYESDLRADEDAFLHDTEKRLASLISQIDGVGKVSVMLSVKNGAENILAIDEELLHSSSESEDGRDEKIEEKKTVVTVDGENGKKPVAIKYIYPEYLGAVIVAQGADSASIRLAITQAVSSYTGLGVGSITVLSMKK